MTQTKGHTMTAIQPLIAPLVPPPASAGVATSKSIVGLAGAIIMKSPLADLVVKPSLTQGGAETALRSIGVDDCLIDFGGRQDFSANVIDVRATVNSLTAQAEAIGVDRSEVLLRAGNDTLSVEAEVTGAGPGRSIAVRNSFLNTNRGDDVLTLRGQYWGDRAVVFGGDGNDRITCYGIGRDSFIQAGSGDDQVSLGRLETTAAAAALSRRVGGPPLPVSTYRGGAGFDVLQLRDTLQADFAREATWVNGAESGWRFRGAMFSEFESIVFG